MTDQHKRTQDPHQLAKSIIDRVTGQQPSPVQGVTGKNSAEVPNMSQRTVMQCLSLDDWKVVAHLPVPVGELMVSRLLDYGWIESRSEKQGKAIRLTPAGLKALRSRAV
jgi:hypothetical protein